jgi:hypothetical protein
MAGAWVDIGTVMGDATALALNPETWIRFMPLASLSDLSTPSDDPCNRKYIRLYIHL